MKRTRAAGLILAMIVMQLLVLVLVAHVWAFIPEPYELWGVAYDELGGVLPNGAPIRTFVDGVDYSNKTSVFSRPAMQDGYFDVDTFGNYKKILGDNGTPWIKEGADDNEPIMYVWGDMSNNTPIGGPSQPWLTARVFNETHNWQTNLPPQHGDLHEAPQAMQPPLVKIFSIVTNSTLPPYTDYLYLRNPTPNPVSASAFYLQKDVLNNTSGPIVQPPSTVIPPFGELYVDTGNLSYFVESGDNVRLVWKNPGGIDAPFGGSDIVVDRVEFNATVGGTLYWEPGNTIQRDELAPPRGYQTNRSESCRDTNSVESDFHLDIEMRQNDPPSKPDPICVQGLCNWNIDSRLFHITVLSNFLINWTHRDPDGEPQGQANVYISTIPNGGSKIWAASVNGPNQFVTYSGLLLLPANSYCLGVQTKDASLWGPWTELCFRTNGLPPSVNRLAPTNGLVGLPAIPDMQVWWSAMSDPDPGDLLNYSWTVSTSPIMTPIIAGGMTTNNHSDPFATNPSTTYYWCVNETDGWQWVNECNAPWQFSTATPPTPPFANNLRIATYDSSNVLRLHMTNRVDPLLDWDFNPSGRSQTGFLVEVRRQSDNSLYWELNNTGAGGDLSQVTYAGLNLVDGICYHFQVEVRDNGAPQLWSTSFSTPLDFCINTPPPVPTPLAPADSSIRMPGSTIVYWSVVMDADAGDTVTYSYCIGTSDPPNPGCSIATGAPMTNNSNAFTTTDGTNYYWVVRAFDSYEYSAYSIVWNFKAGIPPAPPSVTMTKPSGGEYWQGGSNRLLEWTFDDLDTPLNAMSFYMNYTIGASSFQIAGPLIGTLNFSWTLPTIDASGVVVNITAIDAFGLASSDISGQFAVDSTPPLLFGVIPAAWNVPISTEVQAAFSEPIEAPQGQEELGLGLFDDDAASWVRVSYERMPAMWPQEVHLLPVQPLRICGNYTTIVNGTIADRAAWTIGGMSTWSFHTVCPPRVSLSDSLAAKDWSGGSSHDLIWSMSDEQDTQLPIWINLSAYNGVDGYPDVVYSAIRPIGVTTYSWSLPVLDTTNARLRLTVVDGSGLSTFVESAVFTVDSTPPSILSSVPANGSFGITTADDIQVIFDEAVDRSSANQSVSVSPDPGGISLAWQKTMTGRDLMLIAHNPFSLKTDYKVSFGMAIRDDSDPGNHPEEALTIKFSTKPPPPTNPPVAKAIGRNQVSVGESVTFDGSQSTGNITQYVWTISDSQNNTLKVVYGITVTHAFTQNGRYRVTLRVIDEVSEAWDEDSLDVIVSGGDVVLTGGVDAGVIILLSGVIATTAILGGTEIGRIALISLLVVPAYRRKTKGKEDPETRGMIKAYVMLNPGDTYTDIKQSLKLNDGTLQWHLMKLEKDEAITSKVKGTHRHYYPAGIAMTPEDGVGLHDLQGKMITAVGKEPGKPVKLLAEELGVSSQLALYHLRKLQQGNLISLERKGLSLRAYPVPERNA